MATEVINAEWEDYCADAPKLQAGIEIAPWTSLLNNFEINRT